MACLNLQRVKMNSERKGLEERRLVVKQWQWFECQVNWSHPTEVAFSGAGKHESVVFNIRQFIISSAAGWQHSRMLCANAIRGDRINTIGKEDSSDRCFITFHSLESVVDDQHLKEELKTYQCNSDIIQNQTFRVWLSTKIFYQQQAGNHKSEYLHLL